MKTWKKVVIGLGVLGVLLIGILGYGIMKVSDSVTQKLEPDMQQYVKMSTEEQNQYVLQHMDQFMATLRAHDTKNEEAATFDAVHNDPAVRQAGLEWGRSLCAIVVVNSNSISSELDPAEKAKYEKEADEQDQRGDKFTAELDRVIKATQPNQQK